MSDLDKITQVLSKVYVDGEDFDVLRQPDTCEDNWVCLYLNCFVVDFKFKNKELSSIEVIEV